MRILKKDHKHLFKELGEYQWCKICGTLRRKTPQGKQQYFEPKKLREMKQADYLKFLKNEGLFTKLCKQCGKEKQFDSFGKERSTLDGLRHTCQTCFSKKYNDKARLANKEITLAIVHELFNYDHKTGILTNKTNRGSRAKKNTIAGCKDSDGYLQIWIDYKNYKAHVVAWLHYYGYLPENDIDHIDRIKHHNWINNLREVSHICNMRNTGNPKHNTSGVKGVCWNKSSEKWIAQITLNGKKINLGLYEDFNNAVCARLSGEQCLNWSNCDSSSPAYQHVQKILT